ncbi:MAG: hypothetical protein ACTHJ9_04450 [Rhodanobacter sp.]
MVTAPDWYSAQQDILAHLRADTTLAQADIMEGYVSDTYDVPLVGTTIKPHVLVKFLGLVHTNDGQHITGAAWDSQIGQFTVASVAGDEDTARQLSQRVRNSLIGYEPVGCGEIVPAFFAGIGVVSATRTPMRFSADQAYRTLVVSSGV